MVNIKLDSQWSLLSDKHNWTLAKDGKATWFFSTVGTALQEYIDQKLRDSESRDINTLLLRQKQIVDGLNRALAPLEIVIGTKNEVGKSNGI